MVKLAKAGPGRLMMEEQEMDADKLFHFLNEHEGEYFVRVVWNEEGEFFGEENGCGVSEAYQGWADLVGQAY